MANMLERNTGIAPIVFKAGTRLGTGACQMLEFLKYCPESSYVQKGGKIHFLREVKISISVKLEVRFGDEEPKKEIAVN